MRVKDVMVGAQVIVEPEESALKLARLMKNNGMGSVILVEDGRHVV